MFRSTEDVNLKSQSLRVLQERHGQYHHVDGVPIHNLLEKIRIKATNTACQDWYEISSENIMNYRRTKIECIAFLRFAFVGK